MISRLKRLGPEAETGGVCKAWFMIVFSNKKDYVPYDTDINQMITAFMASKRSNIANCCDKLLFRLCKIVS